jgi:diguanylate cyclase (GGDEF)-like protein
MEATSFPRRTFTRVNVTRWAWWELPGPIRAYVAAVVLAAVAAFGFSAAHTTWHLTELLKFLLLMACGLISVAATPRIPYAENRTVKDFITVWVLPVAVLLPPVFTPIMLVPLLALTQARHQGILYRRVFSGAAIALAYSAGSLAFRAFPASFAGNALGTGTHAITWVVAVIVCELIGGRGHQFIILGAIKLSDPSVRLTRLELNREALLGTFAEFDLAVLITLVVAANPLFAVLAVPTVLLARRFMMHAPLVEQSRIDAKTGLLNATTWDQEAAVEVERAVRTRAPLAVALIDIDHFKKVNDTYGHLAGDRALKAVTRELRNHLRGYDLAGRFGGEEFALLLPNATPHDARNIAERLRTHVAGMVTPVNDDPACETFVALTISIGVATLDGVEGANLKLPDLMATADTALYQAKQTGRNRTQVIASITRPPESPPGSSTGRYEKLEAGHSLEVLRVAGALNLDFRGGVFDLAEVAGG